MDDFGLYVIVTRPRLSYERIAGICVERGVKMLQLREKHLSDRELLDAACRMRAVTAGTGTMLVVNDRPDIALLSGADALHLGQDDIPFARARRIVGADMPIGLSTHSLEQARAALALNPAYIGFGPVWPTPAKAKPDPAVGTELLREVVGLAEGSGKGVPGVPVVAIGGIFPENVHEVLQAGARNLAMVRYLMDTEDTAERIDFLQSKIAEYRDKSAENSYLCASK